MRHDIAGKRADHRFSILDFAIEHGIHELLHIDQLDVQEFVLVGLGPLKR